MATKPVDCRKGTKGLAAVVRETVLTDPFRGVLNVFRAKRADLAKRIFGTAAPSMPVTKRLENCDFRWLAVCDEWCG